MDSPNGFRRLLAAAALSSFGDGVRLVAFPLIGASLTRDPRTIAALAAVGTLPSLVGALPVGEIVDRMHRARLMVVVDAARGLALGVLVLIIATGHLEVWHLLVLALLLGIGQLFFDISSSALAPTVVPATMLARFNGYLASTQQAGTGLIGPACAGLLYAVSQETPFAVDGATFLLSALIVSSLARREAKPRPERNAEQDSRPLRELTSNVREGIRWLLADRPLLAMVGLFAGWSLFGWIAEAVLVLYVKEDLHASNAAFGLLLSVCAAGAVLGGIAASRIVTRFGAAHVLTPCLVLYGLCLLPPAFLSSQTLVGIDFFVQGFPVVIFSVASVTIRQSVVPSAILGRITSIFYLAGAGLAPVGLLLGGVIGGWTGLRSTFLFGGLGVVAIALVLARPVSALAKRPTGAELVETSA